MPKSTASSKKSESSDHQQKLIKESAKKNELTVAFDNYESILTKHRFLSGEKLSSLDKDAFEFLKPHVCKLNGDIYPYLMAYFSLVSQFNLNVMKNWPDSDDNYFHDIFGENDRDF